MLYTAYYNPLPLQIYLHNDLEGWLQVWHYQSSSEFHTGMWKTSLWSIPHSLCTPCPTQVSLLGFLHTHVWTPQSPIPPPINTRWSPFGLGKCTLPAQWPSGGHISGRRLCKKQVQGPVLVPRCLEHDLEVDEFGSLDFWACGEDGGQRRTTAGPPRSRSPGKAPWPGLSQCHLPPCLPSTSSHSVLLKNSLWLGFLYTFGKNFDSLLSFPGGKLLQGLCHLQVITARYVKLQSTLCLLSCVCVSSTCIHRDIYCCCCSN